jgi:hypothetical protein
MNRRLALMLSVFFFKEGCLSRILKAQETPRIGGMGGLLPPPSSKKKSDLHSKSTPIQLTLEFSTLFSTNIHKYRHHRPRTQEEAEEE